MLGTRPRTSHTVNECFAYPDLEGLFSMCCQYWRLFKKITFICVYVSEWGKGTAFV